MEMPGWRWMLLVLLRFTVVSSNRPIAKARYQRSSRLDVKLALEIAAQVAAGLAAVPEQHLIHRDIKPTNIM
jgi:serine/threonine protein kinase